MTEVIVALATPILILLVLLILAERVLEAAVYMAESIRSLM